MFYACIYATPGLGFDSCCLQAGAAHLHTSSCNVTAVDNPDDVMQIKGKHCSTLLWKPNFPMVLSFLLLPKLFLIKSVTF